MIQIGETCPLCARPMTPGAILTFSHGRKGEQVELEIAICKECGSRIEKHLKRVVPRRLMRFTEMEPPRTSGGGRCTPKSKPRPLAARKSA